MKYSEFETIAKENGWEFDIDEVSNRWVYADKNGFEIAISKSTQNYLDLYAKKRCVINLIEEKEFIKACYELAETPIRDREDEKYYIVELPFLTCSSEKVSLFRFLTEPRWSAKYSSRFTEEEIKEIDPRLWGFAVEVKE